MDDVGFFRWAARYKFTLAMENYVCDDYVTEKLWRPLRLGSVPIVFGAPNIKVICILRKRNGTVNHLIFEASNFGDFNTLTYWRSLILAVSQFNVL